MIFNIKSKLESRIKHLLQYYLKSAILSESTGKINAAVKICLLQILLSIRHNKFTLGALWSKPTFLSRIASFIGMTHNLNHLGNVYTTPKKHLVISQQLEKKVIEWNKEVIGCKNKNIEGYITSGGTESNLFLMWLGREWLTNQLDVKPILLSTDFTHYSVSKAGRILGLNKQTVAVSEKTWGMSPLSLENKINQLLQQGYNAIMLPITLGYSSTGVCDPLDEIVSTMIRLQKKNSQLKCYLWVDAASQGLPMAFLEENYRPLSHPLIQGYLVDFHKFGQTPVPSGIVFYRKHLRKLIQTPIDYLSEDDTTLSGSRPGFSTLAIWANITSKSKLQWRQHYLRLAIEKQKFIDKFKKILPNSNIISQKKSLIIAIVINKNLKRFPKTIENKYYLRPCNVGNKRHYKLHFLNHGNLTFLNKFIQDIKQELA